jgi:hypothetical protein
VLLCAPLPPFIPCPFYTTGKPYEHSNQFTFLTSIGSLIADKRHGGANLK